MQIERLGNLNSVRRPSFAEFSSKVERQRGGIERSDRNYEPIDSNRSELKQLESYSSRKIAENCSFSLAWRFFHTTLSAFSAFLCVAVMNFLARNNARS